MKTPGKRHLPPSKKLCEETKLKEFQFKLIHRIVVTKKQLCRFGVKPDDDGLYWGEKDSFDHSFKDCRFVISSHTEVIQWFDARNNPNINPSIEKNLFRLDKGPHNKEPVKK